MKREHQANASASAFLARRDLGLLISPIYQNCQSSTTHPTKYLICPTKPVHQTDPYKTGPRQIRTSRNWPQPEISACAPPALITYRLTGRTVHQAPLTKHRVKPPAPFKRDNVRRADRFNVRPGRLALRLRGFGNAATKSAASLRVNFPTGLLKCTHAAAPAPNTPGAHSAILR